MAKILGRSTDRKIVIVVSAAAGLLFFHWLGWLAPVENNAARALAPAMEFFYSSNATLRARYSQATDKRNLAQEVARLHQDNARLLSENAQLQYLREENKVLRKYVTLVDEAKYNYLLVRVIAREAVARSVSENNRLVINRGAKDGLVPGLLIADQDGMAVAKITSVKDYLSEAALITSPECRLSVALNQTQKTMGVAMGDSGLTVKVDYIPQAEKVAVGDILVTSGLETDIPPGLVVGRITEVNKSNNEIWQTAVVEPQSDLDNLRILSVIMPATKAK